MQMQHGRLMVDLPAEWTDRSTLLFVGPPPAVAPTTQAKQAQPSLSISFVRAPAGDEQDAARKLLDDELAGLQEMKVGFHALGVEPFSCALGAGALSRHTLTLDGVTLRQLHAVVVKGALAVKAAASCAELDAAAVEGQLLTTLKSLRLA